LDCFYSNTTKLGQMVSMLKFLDQIPYSILIVATVFMLLAPFYPLPHVIEKLNMLKNGTLTKPLDIFDLFFHLLPTILLVVKIIRGMGVK